MKFCKSIPPVEAAGLRINISSERCAVLNSSELAECRQTLQISLRFIADNVSYHLEKIGTTDGISWMIETVKKVSRRTAANFLSVDAAARGFHSLPDEASDRVFCMGSIWSSANCLVILHYFASTNRRHRWMFLLVFSSFEQWSAISNFAAKWNSSFTKFYCHRHDF